MYQISIFIMILFVVSSCKKNTESDITIGSTLYEHQTVSDNIEIRNLIKGILKHDEKALKKLCNYNCGSGSGCYDLGDIIVQILYIIGESEFISMAKKLDKQTISKLERLIQVGFEYGISNVNEKMESKTIEDNYPILFEFLQKNRLKK